MPKEEEVIPTDNMDEVNEIDETNSETNDAFAAYLAEGPQKDREVRVTNERRMTIGSFKKRIIF